MYQVAKTVLEWCNISFLLQIKVEYGHFILVSPETAALITIPHNNRILLFIVITFHLSTFDFWLDEVLINSDVGMSVISLLKDS